MSDRRINFFGWLLFVGSALGFLVSALRSGDIAALVGAVLFLVACLVFLIPFVRSRGK